MTGDASKPRATMTALSIAVVAGIATTAGLWSNWSDRTIGVALAVCLGAIGIALVTWANTLPIDHNIVQLRDDLAQTDDDRVGFNQERQLTAQTLGRRPALKMLFAGALATLGAAVLSPLRFLGAGARGDRYRTSWVAGRRLVTSEGRPIVAAGGALDQLATVFPELHTDADDSQVVLLRMPLEVLSEATVSGGAVDGWVAYSKICTHAGCSVGLFGIDDRLPDVVRQLVCPCHQSVFDPTNAAKPMGGPAPRSLPQLRLGVDEDGHLIALADFDRPVGPAAWGDK